MATLKPLWLSLGDLSSRLHRSRLLYLVCDYDGTLTPIVDHPNAARLPIRTRTALDNLSRDDDIRLAVISGRKIEDLEKQVGVKNCYLVGAAGLETQTTNGNRTRHLDPENALPSDLRPSLQTWCERFPGAWVEDKDISFALHYRGVAPDLQPAFGAGVRRRVRPFKSQASLIHGKRVFEVMPAVNWNKGSAIRNWLDEAQTEGTLMFFGDDTNDEPVHELVRERGGVAVAVGRTVSRAEYGLPSPTEVMWFLEWLEREWKARPHSVRSEPESSVLQNLNA
jgi:trehalose 6-phosphate phosphatase